MTTIGWQKAEGALTALAALGVAFLVPNTGWLPWLMLLAPDLGMLGYLGGPRVGAMTYNAVHLYACGLIIMLLGTALGLTWLIAAGALWLAHVGIDRALGYGLKSAEGFHHTHLGRIGRDQG